MSAEERALALALRGLALLLVEHDRVRRIALADVALRRISDALRQADAEAASRRAVGEALEVMR